MVSELIEGSKLLEKSDIRLFCPGAVVAREYGLPCIVGAVDATKIFSSGDQILLDTSTGTISKVKM